MERSLADVEDEARAAYRDPSRHYHDELHLNKCLALLGEIEGLKMSERLLLQHAILWHEIGRAHV